VRSEGIGDEGRAGKEGRDRGEGMGQWRTEVVWEEGGGRRERKGLGMR